MMGLVTQSGYAKDAGVATNEEIRITLIGINGKPTTSLRLNDGDDDNFNRFELTFNVDGVKTVLITDMNAEQNKCSKHHRKYPFFVVLDPKNNVHEIKTRIYHPCLWKNHANFKLSVVSAEDKQYYNDFQFDVVYYAAD
jgi:hypothetical protein